MNIFSELLEIAKKLDAFSAESKKPEVYNPIKQIGEAVTKIHKSFSGSWLGYHANVFYRDFLVPPPGAHFSPEWGLKEFGYSTDLGSHGDWVEFDYDTVKAKVYELAGNPDLEPLRVRAREVESISEDSKSEILSMIVTALNANPDPYLASIRSEVEKLEVVSAGEIVQRWNPTKGVITRDMIALGQGARAPAHKRIDAEAIEIHNAFALPCELGKLAEKAAKHLARNHQTALVGSTAGAFITAGGAFDAFVAIGKVLENVKGDVLIVDPYMDAKTLTDYAPSIGANSAKIRLLADETAHKKTLKPAVENWIKQHGTKHPLEARLANAGTLHDRLVIVDGKEVWVLTQSLNAFATRAPASILKAEDAIAKLKITTYENIWATAKSLP